MADYVKWLNKELEKASKAYYTASDNYQETGDPRYARSQEKAENMQKAFVAALAVENKRLEDIEHTRRVVSGLWDTAKKYQATMPVEEALGQIIADLRMAKMFGE